MNLTELGRFLNVSAERARQVAADDPTFPGAGERDASPLEPRQGRAMGRAALVGHAVIEEAALVVGAPRAPPR